MDTIRGRIAVFPSIHEADLGELDTDSRSRFLSGQSKSACRADEQCDWMAVIVARKAY
jgi:hypothetical protein